MTSRLCFLSRALLALTFVMVAACSPADPAPAPPPAQSWSNICIDHDGDGFGFQCEGGSDCDDDDATLSQDCGACKKPDKGCECEEGTAPITCKLPYELDNSGILICHEGTRFCRDGSWTGCEGVRSFAAPGGPGQLNARGRIDRDAAPILCDPCNPDCYRIEDPLRIAPTGTLGAGIISAQGGGITLGFEGPDGGVSAPDAETLMPGTCATGDDDCDGLPNMYDRAPNTRPAGATQQAIFLHLGPGESATRNFEHPVRPRSVDVYFFLDQTFNMGDERTALWNDLQSGNFLPGGGTGVYCPDLDSDGEPDDYLKENGIFGGLTCAIRDLNVGAGWFRDIPFRGPDVSNGLSVAPADYELFEHEQDLTGNLDSLLDAIISMTTRRNYDVPEGSSQGLWALATGGELYAGWNRPGVPPRRGCPAGTWGYPCFRDGALPVIVHITDAPMHNGPTTSAHPETTPSTPAGCLGSAFSYNSTDVCQPVDYAPSVLQGLSAGSDAHYQPLTTSAETFATAQPVGAIDNVLVTYAGDSTRMTADFTFATTGNCPATSHAWQSWSQGGPDVVFRFDVTSAGSYLLSTRGSRFDGTLMLLRANADGTASAPIACADYATPFPNDPSLANDAAEMTPTLTPGSYFVILKGLGYYDWGPFQMTLGRADLQTSGSFAARPWQGTDGTLDALTQRGIRVVTVQSGSDVYLSEQARALAASTGASDPAGTPITIRMDADLNIGDEVVDVVKRATTSMTGRIGVRLLQSPDDPTPDFGFRVEALDWSGDCCTGAVLDTDGDTFPDTHAGCVGDAAPRFRVTFSNPAQGPVPANPADPQGGYLLTMQVVMDGRFVLEEYPVYIIPSSLNPGVPQPRRIAVGTYEETVPAKGCEVIGQSPTWRTFAWDATLPAGTEAQVFMCSADTESGLDGCTYQRIALLQPGADCDNAADCGTLGYCAPQGICHLVTGLSCTTDESCGFGGTCRLSDHVCTFSRASADLAASTGLHGHLWSRVRIELHSDTARAQAPTVQRWRLDYSCAPQE